MILTLASTSIAIACAAASARRLSWAVAPTSLDPDILADALAGPDGEWVGRGLSGALAGNEALAWEYELVGAFREPEGPRRAGTLNLQLLELDGRAQRWSRVPRISASIATSAGFLFASIALLQGLSLAGGEIDADTMNDVLASALGPLSVGIAGTSFCVAAHVRAARVLRRRLAGFDRVLSRLEVRKVGQNGNG